MKYLKVNKFELNMAICEDNDNKLFGIEKNELPEGLKVGDILSIDSEGNLKIDIEEAKRREKEALKSQNKIVRKKM